VTSGTKNSTAVSIQARSPTPTRGSASALGFPIGTAIAASLSPDSGTLLMIANDILMLQRTNLTSPTIDCLPQYVAQDRGKYFGWEMILATKRQKSVPEFEKIR
jgi:hypothetical protein